MKNICLVILLIVTVACTPQQKDRTLKVVEFTGSGHALGLQHGKALKSEIASLVRVWKENTSEVLQRDADEVLKEFFEYADFEEDIKKWTPDLYKEIQGIAEGSQQDFQDILLLNLLDEFWVYVNNINNTDSHHCSSMGVPEANGRPGYISQNMDLESFRDGYQVLMRIKKTKDNPEQLILTYPGLVGLNGLNDKGIGVVVNTLMQLKASSEGLPVAFVVRGLINATSKDEMLDFVQNIKHASGQNYILGIKGEVYDFEASTNKVVRYAPDNENGIVYHTNHPLVNDDVKPWFAQFAPNVQVNKKTNSHYRYDALDNRLSDAANVNDQFLISVLISKDNKDNPVCRANNGRGGFTFSSVVMTLDAGNPVLKITAGPPDESEFRSFNFK
ncbi:C45 family autoproteolytic acyltransferase/hydolase [Allomuricauda sp. CP2A]|jgi:hypothetical protein|uniref:C45 family autoproteolytic acyltransferase/hydolase n=1 Tax=Allomuricauda sp. CP2A TaxID=1848189 RepID=UPI0008295129|nr:C45 family peptidase [Muricauda sp. CP2A]